MSGEQALWCAVLEMAVTDALVGSRIGGRVEKIKATHKARRYFTTPNADFNQVCHMARLDPIAVRNVMNKRIASAPSVESLFPKTSKPRSSTRYMTLAGETLTISQWSSRTGLSTYLICNRLALNWSEERTLTTPARKRAGQRCEL